MENPEAPKRRGWANWSIIRKAQVIGVLIGAFGTPGFILIGEILNNPRAGGHGGGLLSFLGVFQILFCLPAHLIYKLFGKRFVLSSDQDGSMFFAYVSLGLINAILLFFIGTFIGWLIQKSKAKN